MYLQLEIWPVADVKFVRDFLSPQIVVGRSTDCTLTIAHDVVSNLHAKFYVEEGKCLVSDLKSTNGTFVNQSKILTPTEIREGDQIVLGVDGPMLIIAALSVDGISTLTETKPIEVSLRELAAEPAEVLEHQPTQLETSPAQPAVSAAASTDDREAASQISLPEMPVLFVPPELVAGGHAGSRDSVQSYDPYENIPRPSGYVFHVISLFLTIPALLACSLGYLIYTRQNPARGYTFFGIVIGVLGTLLFSGVVIYFLRKRWGQELLPGKLRTWLRMHFWFSLAGIWLVLLHAGFNFDGGAGTWTLFFLFLTITTGIIGWFFYNRLPLVVYGKVGNLASADLRAKIRRNQDEIEDAVAGKSGDLASLAQQVLAGRDAAAVNLVPKEHVIAQHIVRLGNQCQTWKKRIRAQSRLHFWLRSWLWLHIPIAFVFVGMVFWHALDATEAKWLVVPATPQDYAASETCAKCHQSQYDEWIGSMHAISQSSPVTELQNRLVLLKEQRDLQTGAISEPIVGTLCVRCHAPTGYLGPRRKHEDPLSKIGERAPASQFGVSCVACHQIEQIHKGDPGNDPDNLEYKNIENLEYTQGKLMVGPIGGAGDRPSVGNSEHRGEFRSYFKDSSLCASCHTVVVDHPSLKDERGRPERIVKLQDTYTEWLDGGKDLNWSSQGVQCLDCHGRDLGNLVQTARRLQESRTPLAERLQEFARVFGLERQNLPATRQAAIPENGYDAKLPDRRRFLHTFSGVDYHLETALPYLDGHPRQADNKAIQAQTVERAQELLKIAAAIRIESVAGDTATVEVLNMGTGHHLPAGFSFAREMWIEVSVSAKSLGDAQDDWKVIIGGQAAKPIENSTSLNKRQAGLINFQSVLYSGAPVFDADGQLRGHERGEEVVLQNETRAVLTGETAREQGFLDREKFLLPGEIRQLSMSLPAGWDSIAGARVQRVRVRLLFRNYPPEFLIALSNRFAELSDAPNAARARNLVKNLRIHEMAQDTLPR